MAGRTLARRPTCRCQDASQSKGLQHGAVGDALEPPPFLLDRIKVVVDLDGHRRARSGARRRRRCIAVRPLGEARLGGSGHPAAFSCAQKTMAEKHQQSVGEMARRRWRYHPKSLIEKASLLPCLTLR